MTSIRDLFKHHKRVGNFLSKTDSNRFSIHVSQTVPNVNRLLAAETFQTSKATCFYVASNIYKAQEAYEVFLTLVGADKVSLFPVDELVTTELLAASPTFRLERIDTIRKLLDDEPRIVVTHTVGALRLIPSRTRWMESILTLETGKEEDIKVLAEKLVSYGYKRTPQTVNQGEYSVRGSILDVFPFQAEKPFRIELFDIEIESIRSFDPETQMTVGNEQRFEIFPAYEIFYSEEEKKSIIEKIKVDAKIIDDELEKDLRNFENHHDPDRLNRYVRYVDEGAQTLFGMCKDPIVFFDNYTDISDNYKQSFFDLAEYLANKKTSNGVKHVYFEPIETLPELSNKMVFFSEFARSLPGIHLSALCSMEAASPIDYTLNPKAFLADLEASRETKTIILCAPDAKRKEYFEQLLKNASIPFREHEKFPPQAKKGIHLVECENAVGYTMLEEGVSVLTTKEIIEKTSKHKSRFKTLYQETIRISSKEDLSRGDYVVHQDYGIGRYLGIRTIDLKNVKNDYIEVMYEEDRTLYIPVENIHMLEKYVGSEGSVPKLTKLGSKEWEKKKEKIREKLEDIADKLIEIQAARESTAGTQYKVDSPEQAVFEAGFEFVETSDQTKAIADVKKDMESRFPMDRLICGDVGFGKTEVAMRAAFKAIENGKQVAYLAPTTVLSRQHYYTFKERFEKFGMRIELLNRFVDSKMQKSILQGLEKGYVDVIIGTHRLLSSDVRFKDLGVLVIDEEQRFGVEHKEQIKAMKHNVDVLSLSATPIPRTLQMSLMGIRDMSLLETPPTNRYPIQTYVVESNDIIIREAVYRELSRGGQVFYLHNRINGLDRVRRKISQLVPNARIETIHGKMGKDDIEDVMRSFIDKECDVLICTTIIETGVDIPNANTLLIDDADKLGLAQIYQIRGRVGRSDRLAYAYLMYQSDKVLTETSQKRLEAIKEFTALGSGYKIAVRDLAIRGAGDILGREQSGFIDAIGVDLYMKMLSEAVEKKKGHLKKAEEAKNFSIEVSKHIPNRYVSDDAIKIEIHKRIGRIRSREDQSSITEEMRDRFGRLSDEVLLYIEEKYLEHLLRSKGIEQYVELSDRVNLNFTPGKTQTINGEGLFRLGMMISNSIKFDYKNRRIKISMYKKDFKPHYIYALTKLLENV